MLRSSRLPALPLRLSKFLLFWLPMRTCCSYRGLFLFFGLVRSRMGVYCVAPQKRLAVGNYGFALLSPVRLVYAHPGADLSESGFGVAPVRACLRPSWSGFGLGAALALLLKSGCRGNYGFALLSPVRLVYAHPGADLGWEQLWRCSCAHLSTPILGRTWAGSSFGVAPQKRLRFAAPLRLYIRAAGLTFLLLCATMGQTEKKEVDSCRKGKSPTTPKRLVAFFANATAVLVGVLGVLGIRCLVLRLCLVFGGVLCLVFCVLGSVLVFVFVIHFGYPFFFALSGSQVLGLAKDSLSCFCKNIRLAVSLISLRLTEEERLWES